MCGDARNLGAYAQLLGDEETALLWTDPPYGVGYVGKAARKLTIAGDASSELAALVGEALRRSIRCLRLGAPLYVAHPRRSADGGVRRGVP